MFPKAFRYQYVGRIFSEWLHDPQGKLELVQTPQNQPSDGEEVTPSAGQSAAQKEIAANLPQQLHSAQLEPVQQETSHLELPDILIRTESEVDSPSDAETAASSRDETVLQQNEPDRQLQELAATNKSTSATTYRAEGMPVNRLPAAHKVGCKLCRAATLSQQLMTRHAAYHL